MSYFNIEQIRGIEDELKAINGRLVAMTSADPKVNNDPLMFAHLQLNSLIRYLELAILKAGGKASEPPVIG
jgi:hypothetical protein